MSVREAVLGFDVGTTSVKAGLLRLDGTAGFEVASRAYPTSRPRPGRVEQAADDWLAAMRACWQELASRAGPVRIVSVGICSQVNTHVLVDEALRPLGPAITWQDTRASAVAAELDEVVAARREALWGGPFTVDASFALSRLAWWRRHDPAAVEAARWLLAPKDLVVAAITGEVAADPIGAIGLVGADDRYLPDVLALVEGAADLLPPLRPFDAPAGHVGQGDPVGLPAGAPVAVGTMDAWGSVFGSGLVRPGRAMEVGGTSEIVAVLSDRTVPTPGIISFPPVHGGHLHAGPTQAGGAALEWAARGFGRSVEQVLRLAADGRRDPQPLVFLPHLDGERAPYWDPHARGVFLGLTSSTELRHLALAVLEGVGFAARLSLDGCEQAAGRVADDLRLSGGAARSALWNEVKASVHGRPVSVMADPDSGVLGAALIGLVAAGLEPDLASAADRHVRVASTIEPDAGQRTRLDELFGVYRDAYRALAPIFPRLSA